MEPVTGNSKRSLGKLLRYHREGRGWTGNEVGRRPGCSQAQISRLENGRRLPTIANLEALSAAYQLSDEEFAELDRLRRQAREVEEPWWAPYGVGTAYGRLLEAEESAVRCLDYQTVLIPALLQVREYALAVNAMSAADLSRGQVDAHTAVRLRRQERLRDSHPLELEAVVTEAALRFVVGGKDVHSAQVRRLLDVIDQHENVKVLVIPYESGENGTQTGTFNVYEMPFGEADLAFGESVSGTAVITTPLELRRLRRLFTELRASALEPDESRMLISSLA